MQDHIINNNVITQINFDETKTIFEGEEFALKQYGKSEFVTFMKAFFDNYERLHKPLGTLTRELKFEEEQEENFLLQPTSVCLVLERRGEVALTQMVTKRDERPINLDKIIGLDYKSFYENEAATGHTLYYFSKGSVNLSLFSDEERKYMLHELQLLLYYLIFYIARRDNCKNIYTYMNRLMARSMQKQNIPNTKITPYVDFRGIGYAGASYSDLGCDTLMNNYDLEAILDKYFS